MDKRHTMLYEDSHEHFVYLSMLNKPMPFLNKHLQEDTIDLQIVLT